MNFSYLKDSIKTTSYWLYLFKSADTYKTFFATIGVVAIFADLFELFNVIDKDFLDYKYLTLLLLFSAIFTIINKRPVSRISYKIPGKDLLIEIVVGDIFDQKGQKVISTNNTFDTNIYNGLIAENSLQGQFTRRFFPNDLAALDEQLTKALDGERFEKVDAPLQKDRRYEIGMVAPLRFGGEIYLFLAMAQLNEFKTAETDVPNIKNALRGLWKFISQRGEKLDVVVPMIGTGLGRVNMPRKKMTELIAQSFLDYSKTKIFSQKLIIVVHPADVAKFGINLFEVRDYLKHSLEPA